jgi:hypothetical protein
LFLKRHITLEDAVGRSQDPEEIKTMIANTQAGLRTTGAGRQ